MFGRRGRWAMRPGCGLERILDADCLSDIGKGAIGLGLAIEDDTPIDVGAGRARIELDRRIEIGERAVEIAVAVEGHSAVAVEFGISRSRVGRIGITDRVVAGGGMIS